MNSEMMDILVYAADCEDFESEGLVGPLMCTDAEETSQSGAIPELTITHPIDPYGKWRALHAGNILKCWVHMQAPPVIGANDRIESTIEVWTVRDTATAAQRAVYRSSKGNKKLTTLKAGTTVVMLQNPADGRVKIRSNKTTGWMERDGLTGRTVTTEAATGEAIDRILGGAQIRPQLYEIQAVEPTENNVTVTAKHIACRLMKNLVTYESTAEIALTDCLRGIYAACEDPLGDEWSFQTNLTDRRSGISFVDVNPLKALLDPETGVVGRWNCEVIFDNTDIYFLRSAGRDRGDIIEYGANLAGISLTEDMSGVATAIKPVGENKNGTPYYLPEIYVLSPNADRYPYRMIHTVKATDCKIGTNGVTATIARARMREQAQALLDAGCDAIDLSVEVEVMLRSSATAQLAIYDTVRIIYDTMDVRSRIVSRVWDALHGRVKSVKIGSIGGSMDNIKLPSWSIGSVSGSKLMPGTVGGTALADDIISTRHVQAESINTQALVARSVTTEKLAAGSVTAEKIKAGTIEAGALEAVTAKIGQLKAGDIQTDTLAAALATFTVLTAGTATFDAATVQHLVSGALNLEFGVGNDVFINNLKVAYAQMVTAAIGNLCIQASDGHYYTLDVGADGRVTATQASVTPGEIDAGQTARGEVILGTDITAAQLSTGNLLATYALMNRIDAARIDVDTLLARKAFVDALYTSRIYGGQSLEIIIGSQNDAIQTAQDAAGSAQSTAQTAQSAAQTAQTAAQTAQSTAQTAQTAAQTAQSTAQTAQTAAQTAQSAAETAQAGVESAQIAAESAQTTAETTQAALRRVVRIDTVGLHVGDNQNAGNEVLIDSEAVNIVTGGQMESKFAGSYIQFGAYQLRRTADNGLAFKVKEV